jgi:glycerophosphoryl diester phosphodiesterase
MQYLAIALAALAVGGILLIYLNPGPKVTQTEKTAWLVRKPIAHRGLHTDDSDVPENSLKACRLAMEAGYGIEVDLQMTADGKAVVFHDHSLKRMTGVDKKINTLTWDEVKELKLMGSQEGIPLFTQLLDLVQGRVPLLIEIKNEGAPVGQLEAAVIEDLQHYQGEYAVQVFNPFVLKYFKEHAPHITRGQLASSFKGDGLALYKKFLLRYLLLNHLSAPHFIAYDADTLPGWFANSLRQKGLYLLAWTVKSETAARRARELYDNIIFEGFTPE